MPIQSARLVLILLLALSQAGCATLMYYARAGHGQLDLLMRREPITAILSDEQQPQWLKDALGQALAMREFASASLALPENQSYRMYSDLERPFVLWNVFATGEFSVDPKIWCYPIVGCAAYRGHFNEDHANREAARLSGQGYDVFVGGVAAYSTLGRFADPVLNTMLNTDETRLAGLIFHELAHQRLYRGGDSAFSEAFASLVEEEGVRRWLLSRNAPDALEDYREQQRRQRDFALLVERTRDVLRSVYSQEMDAAQMRVEKSRVFREMQGNYEALKQNWGGYQGFDGWFARELNNAHLSAVATYRNWLPAFRALLVRAGGDMDRFYRLAEELADLDDATLARRMQELTAISDGEAGASGPSL